MTMQDLSPKYKAHDKTPKSQYSKLVSPRMQHTRNPKAKGIANLALVAMSPGPPAQHNANEIKEHYYHGRNMSVLMPNQVSLSPKMQRNGPAKKMYPLY